MRAVLGLAGHQLELPGVGAVARHATAGALVRQGQVEGETTVSVQLTGGPLYPPDLPHSSVDLAALVTSPLLLSCLKDPHDAFSCRSPSREPHPEVEPSTHD